MGTPPSYATAPDIQPTARAEALAIETNSIALLNRIAKLEGERLIDAARLGALEAELRALRAGR